MPYLDKEHVFSNALDVPYWSGPNPPLYGVGTITNRIIWWSKTWCIAPFRAQIRYLAEVRHVRHNKKRLRLDCGERALRHYCKACLKRWVLVPVVFLVPMKNYTIYTTLSTPAWTRMEWLYSAAAALCFCCAATTTEVVRVGGEGGGEHPHFSCVAWAACCRLDFDVSTNGHTTATTVVVPHVAALYILAAQPKPNNLKQTVFICTNLCDDARTDSILYRSE